MEMVSLVVSVGNGLSACLYEGAIGIVHVGHCPSCSCRPALCVSAGSPSRGGDVVVFVFDINQPSLPTPFYSVLVSVSVFMAL